MKKVVFRFFLACTLLIGATSMQSCKTASIMKTSSESFAKTNPDDIEVFMSKKPTKKFIELGTVSSSKHVMGFSRSDKKIYKELKEKAASIGGNAIINLTEDLASKKGVVIRYTE
jgi:transcriptional regulator of nitric oxide reductase